MKSDPREIGRKIIGTKVTLVLETDGRREEFPILVDNCWSTALERPYHFENVLRVALPGGLTRKFSIADCHGGEFAYEVNIHGFLKAGGNGAE